MLHVHAKKNSCGRNTNWESCNTIE